MKNKFLKIFIFLLLVAVAADCMSDLWLKTETTIVKVEDGDKGQKKETESEKEEFKDKLFQHTSFFESKINKQSLFVLSHIFFRYSAYLSLPEIPPELS